MSPSYESQLAAVRARAAASRGQATGGPGAGRAPDAGSRARCLAPGKYYGVVGEVVKRGRTRYHLRVPAGILTVPIPLVEAA